MATNIDFQKQNIPFTMVANAVLEDRDLSLEAKAIYAFMYSKPDGWHFSADRIGKELGVSKPTILKRLSELKERGYLLSQKLPNGRMLYKIIFPPIKPYTEDTQQNLQYGSKAKVKKVDFGSQKAKVKKSHGEESLPISNTITIQSNTISLANAPERDFSQEEWIQELTESQQEALELIGAYYLTQKIKFSTRKIANDNLKVHIRASNYLVKNYKTEDLRRGLRWCKEKYSDVTWNLETLKKQLPFILAKND